MRGVIQGILAATLLLGIVSAACAQTITLGPAGPPQGPQFEQHHWISSYVRGEKRQTVIQLRTCRVDGSDTKRPLAVINHGSPADAKARPKMQTFACGSEAVKWFLDKGFNAALPLRRGYGETGGDWAETYGRCSSPNFVDAGLASADDIDSALRYMREQPYVDTNRILIVGQSAGGWATVALASRAPADIWGLVNFAGGRGGWAEDKPNTNCAPDKLVEAAGRYGSSAKHPMLWIYTENDTFFAPSISRGMHDSFVKAGGKAEFEMLPAFRQDGHSLFANREGPRIWGPLVERYIASLPK